MESKMFAFGLFMLFCMVQSSSSLQCYTCHSVNNSNPTCADNKGLETRECLSPSPFGQLFCIKVVVYNGTHDIVNRHCTIKRQDLDLCTLMPGVAKSQNLTVKFCDTCDTDGCNNGNTMQLVFTLIVFGAIVCIARLFV